jgi:hypothetical protein
MRVRVYRNLSPQYRQRRAWSVMALEGPKKGRVIGVVDGAVLRGATFRVSEAGRQRVLREKQKNVHAFAEGELVESRPLDSMHPGASLKRVARVPVSYDPYRGPHFVRQDTQAPIHESAWVVVSPSGVYAAGS